MVAVPLLRPAVTSKVALSSPSGTVTDAGAAAMLGLLLERSTVSPPDGAGAGSVTVRAVRLRVSAVADSGVSDSAGEMDPDATRLIIEREDEWSALADCDVDMTTLEVTASVVYSSTVAIVD